MGFSQTSTASVSPLTTKGDLWGFDTANNRLPVGANTQVLTADSTQALGIKWAAAAAGGGSTLLGQVTGTDGATAAPNANYVSWSTAFSKAVTSTALADLVIVVTVCWLPSINATSYIGLKRGATRIFTSGPIAMGGAAQRTQTFTFTFVDTALAAGTYTYETDIGNVDNSATYTLKSAVLATPALTGEAGPSMMMIFQGANV